MAATGRVLTGGSSHRERTSRRGVLPHTGLAPMPLVWDEDVADAFVLARDGLLGNLREIDVLHPPPITVAIGTGPYFESFFNQIKQEFVSARYLLYEGESQRRPHFSDAGVTLADTRDYPLFGLAGEKVKPDSLAAAPDVTDSEKPAQFRIISLEALVKMKLTSFRDKDRTHLRDLIEVGLLDASFLEKLPPELRSRLQILFDTPEG